MKNTPSEISPKPNSDGFGSEIKSLSDTFRAKHRPEVAELASYAALSAQLVIGFGNSNGISVQRHLEMQTHLINFYIESHGITKLEITSAVFDLKQMSQTAAILSSLPD